MTLDLTKFGKVVALMRGAKTPGEKAAAQAKAEAMAAKAGLTLKQALSKVDAQKQAQARQAPPRQHPNWTDIFRQAEDDMERANPGFKARKAAKEAAVEEVRRRKREEALREFGTEDAVWVATPLEAAVRAAAAPFSDKTVWGYRGLETNSLSDDLWAALRGAGVLPETVAAAWSAYREHQRIDQIRMAFCPDYSLDPWVRLWEMALSLLLDQHPGSSIADARARMDWQDHVDQQDYTRDVERDRALHASMRRDLEDIIATVGQPAPAQTGHTTTTDRRAAVIDLLRSSPTLSDREIARRVGVSPQTVGNQRRKMEASHD